MGFRFRVTTRHTRHRGGKCLLTKVCLPRDLDGDLQSRRVCMLAVAVAAAAVVAVAAVAAAVICVYGGYERRGVGGGWRVEAIRRRMHGEGGS